MLVIGVVCGLMIYEGEKKSAVANLKVNELAQTAVTHLPAQPAPLLSKPAAIVPPVTAIGQHPMMSRHTPDAVPRAVALGAAIPSYKI